MSDSPRSVEASRESPAVRTRTYRARPRRRVFLVTVGDEQFDRPSGFGLTLDEVIADLVDFHASCAARDWAQEPIRDDPREYCDMVVWGERDRLLAVVRMAGDGRGVEIVRFDGAPDAPGGMQAVRFDAPAPTAEGGAS